jgi:hypothetical protein
MYEHDGRYAGPAGIVFTEVELRQLFAILQGGSSVLRGALTRRIDAYLIYLDAMREVERFTADWK